MEDNETSFLAVRVVLLDDDGNRYEKVGYGLSVDDAVANAEAEARAQWKRQDICMSEWMAA